MKEIIPIFDTTKIENLSNNIESLKKLKAAQPNITRAFETNEIWRTPTLLRMSVLNDVKFPTPDAKYWQLVIEMYAHSTALAELGFEIEEKQIDYEEILDNISNEANKRELKRLDIKKRRIEFELVNMQKTAHARIQELHNQNTIMEELKPLLKYGTESANNHQINSLVISWTNEVLGITDHTAVEARNNIIARWITAINILKIDGKYNKFMDSLSDIHKEKLKELNLI